MTARSGPAGHSRMQIDNRGKRVGATHGVDKDVCLVQSFWPHTKPREILITPED